MESNKDKLEKLLKIREKYQYIVETLFDNPSKLSDTEREIFMEKHKLEILEFQKINDDIASLKWSLMTSQEQKDYLDKYSDD